MLIENSENADRVNPHGKAIDSETYDLKLEEYKNRQREIASEMTVYVNK